MRFKSWSWIFIPFLLAMLRGVGVAQIATTQIVDTIYHANGTTATGTVLISWPAFATVNGDQVPSGNTNAVITQGGALTVSLIANSGAIPIGTYYTVTYHLDDNSVTRQYWVVPQSATPVKVAVVQSTVLPTSVAIQMATKTYVDTAIAAATTGHPLDSTPLVLKAGDTMTGPLVLPADPVSSMQASTKHYVDTAVASNVSANITGQTPNYVPLATSATASAASSHFFEQSGHSGVANPFVVYAGPPNCNLNGSTFTQYACTGMEISDDGSTPGNTPRNLDGLNMSMNAWGPGGYAGAEGRTTKLFANSNNSAIVTPGIKQLSATNTSLFGIGDVAGFMNVFTCNAGVAYQSDQGCQNYWAIGQQMIMGGNIRGYFNGTVRSGGTSTQPLFTYIGGCTSPLNQVCAPSPGSWMIDTSAAAATGKFTGASSTFTTGGINWLSQAPTDQTGIPAASAWGYAFNVKLLPLTTWDAPQPQTFTLQGGSGTFAAGDHACMIGTNFTEQQVISAVSGSSPTQTITLPLAMPETSVAIFRGDCQYLSLDADLANLNVRYTYPAVSIDGTNLIYSLPGYSGMAAGLLPHAGVMWAQFDGGPNSGFHTYRGARVTKVGTTNPSWHPFDDTFLLTYLEPNSAFAVGDSIEDPDYPLQKIDGLELTATQNIAPLSVADLSGLRLHIAGPAATGSSTLFRGYNDANLNFYTPWGGRLGEPAFFTQAGAFGNVLSSNYTPLYGAFYFNNHQPGQTAYEIWHDPSWGTLSINSNAQINFDGIGGITTRGPFTASSVSTSIGLSSGIGTGSGDYSGVEFQLPGQSSTWLTPCYNKPGFASTDLCVTGQGSSRNLFNATPDRALRASALYADSMHATSQFANVIEPASGHNICLNDTGGDICPDGSTTPDYIHAGFDFAVNTQTWGGTFGSGGNFSIQANTPGDSHTGGYVFFGGSARGDASKNAVDIYADAYGGVNPAIHVDGPLDAGHNRGFVGINYAAGSIVPHELSVNGTVGANVVNAALYQGPATAPTGACSVVGWEFSQDGHISYCNGTSWITKM